VFFRENLRRPAGLFINSLLGPAGLYLFKVAIGNPEGILFQVWVM